MKSRCPVCDKVIDDATRQDSRIAKFYPFCSNRCKLIDLGKWLDGNYRIAVQANEKEEPGKQAAKTDSQDKAKNG
ncbi:MAG: DNA gyrase inhibitor YacG [Sedimentisphaerales bacterium]